MPLPYSEFAWLLSAGWVFTLLILLSYDVPVPIPHTSTLFVVVISALMGGRLSGFLSALMPVLGGMYLFNVVPDSPGASQSLLNLVLGSLMAIASGFFLGLIRQNLEHASQEIDRQSREIASLTLALAQQVDENEEALSDTRQRLLESQERLRSATRRLIDAQESERRSLAKELHDDIGQSLTALRINLETNKRNFSQDATAQKFIETSYGLVDEIIASIRELSVTLRPSLLDDLGLIAALREYVSKQLGRANIRLDLTIEGDDEAIDSTHSIAAYRIVQEIISNIIKHASADRVDMSLVVNPSKVKIRIRDNGVGFNVDLDQSEQLGLASIRERASLLGGQVEFESKIGEGATVRLQLPAAFNLDEYVAA